MKKNKFPALTLSLLLIISCFSHGQNAGKKKNSQKEKRKKVDPANVLKSGEGLGGDKALLWIEPSIRKVGPLQSARKKTPLWDGRRGKIFLAKNEWESFQVVFRSLGADLELTPQMEILSKQGGAIPKFTFFSTRYIHLKSASDPLGSPGDYPDPLIPLGGPLKVTSKQNALLWINVKSSKDTQSGLYSCLLKLYSKNKVVFRVPLNITVWNFTLPEVPTLKAYYLLDTPSMVQKFHRLSDKGAQRQMIEKYSDLLLNYGMSPGNFDFPDTLDLRVSENRVMMSFDGMDEWLAKVLKKTGVFPLPFPLKALSRHGAYKSKRFEMLVKTTLRQLYDHYEKKGWIDKHFVYIDAVSGYTPKYISDEPYNIGKRGYDEVRYWSKLIHQANPKLKLMVATPPYTFKGWGKIEKAVDYYNYYVAEVDEYAEKTLELAQKGKGIFLVPNSFCDNIDYQGIFHRGLGFFCFKYGLTGIEQWDVMAWYRYKGEPVPNPGKLILPLKWGAGAGVLIYPGKDFGVDGPLSSIRLELNRDAIEDYDYFYLLAKKSGKEYARQIASRLIPQTYAEMEPSEDLFSRIRQFMAREILRFQKGGQKPAFRTGKVINSKGKAIKGVAVIAKYTATLTDSKGQYRIYCPEGEAGLSLSSLLYQEKKIRAGEDGTLKKLDSKILFGFENRDEEFEVAFEDEEEEEREVRRGWSLSKSHTTQGKKALKLRIPRNYNGSVEFSGFPANWTGYRYLVVDVYNPEDYPLVVDLEIADKKQKTREVDQDVICPGKRQVALPGQTTTLVFALKELKIGGIIGFYYRPALDTSRINWFALLISNEKQAGPVTAFLDNLRLIQ